MGIEVYYVSVFVLLWGGLFRGNRPVSLVVQLVAVVAGDILICLLRGRLVIVSKAKRST